MAHKCKHILSGKSHSYINKSSPVIWEEHVAIPPMSEIALSRCVCYC